MKFEIYPLGPENKINKNGGYFAIVDAKNHLSAIKKFYIHYLNLYSTPYLKNKSCFGAVKIINI